MLEKLAFHVSTPLNGAPLELDVVKTTSQSAIWPPNVRIEKWAKSVLAGVRVSCPLKKEKSNHKRTFALRKAMSALPPKADMCGATMDVR